jgi:hypothetical protein
MTLRPTRFLDETRLQAMDDKARELKRQWVSAQKGAARAKFPLLDDTLEHLFDAVETRIENVPCDHSLRAATEWLRMNSLAIEPVVAWLQDNGGFCDCEVVANARDHWEQNRV